MQNLNPSLTLITLTLLILHITAFHLFLNHGCYLQNIFYAKIFATQTYQKCIMPSLCLNLWSTSKMIFTCSKQWKHKFVKYVKYAWKLMRKICSKPTIKAQEQHRWCSSDVFIVNFRRVRIENLVEHPCWSFFLQLNVQEIFNWVLNMPLKIWADFNLINCLWFGWVTWRYSISFVSRFIQIF